MFERLVFICVISICATPVVAQVTGGSGGGDRPGRSPRYSVRNVSPCVEGARKFYFADVTGLSVLTCVAGRYTDLRLIYPRISRGVENCEEGRRYFDVAYVPRERETRWLICHGGRLYRLDADGELMKTE